MATFFFDNDISYRIVDALRHLVHGHELLALREKFPTAAKDTEWIPTAGKEGWIVISRDFNQRRREPEHEALIVNKVRALYIRQSGKQIELFADAARIIKQWPKIQAWGLTAKPGTLVKLDTNDKIIELKK